MTGSPPHNRFANSPDTECTHGGRFRACCDPGLPRARPRLSFRRERPSRTFWPAPEGHPTGSPRCLLREEYGLALEVVPMRTGSGVEASAEGAVHRLGGSESADVGDVFDRAVRGLQKSAGGLHADSLYVVRGSDSDLRLENSGELAFGEVDVSGECRH